MKRLKTVFLDGVFVDIIRKNVRGQWLYRGEWDGGSYEAFAADKTDFVNKLRSKLNES